MNRPIFEAIRPCAIGDCEPGCNCTVIPVQLDVDELTEAELVFFQHHGSNDQKSEIEAWQKGEAA